VNQQTLRWRNTCRENKDIEWKSVQSAVSKGTSPVRCIAEVHGMSKYRYFIKEFRGNFRLPGSIPSVHHLEPVRTFSVQIQLSSAVPAIRSQGSDSCTKPLHSQKNPLPRTICHCSRSDVQPPPATLRPLLTNHLFSPSNGLGASMEASEMSLMKSKVHGRIGSAIVASISSPSSIAISARIWPTFTVWRAFHPCRMARHRFVPNL